MRSDLNLFFCRPEFWPQHLRIQGIHRYVLKEASSLNALSVKHQILYYRMYRWGCLEWIGLQQGLHVPSEFHGQVHQRFLISQRLP